MQGLRTLGVSHDLKRAACQFVLPSIHQNKRIMLRDKNANREFEASLSYEVKRIKIAARKLHNCRMTDYVDPRAECLLREVLKGIISITHC